MNVVVTALVYWLIMTVVSPFLDELVPVTGKLDIYVTNNYSTS